MIPVELVELSILLFQQAINFVFIDYKTGVDSQFFLQFRQFVSFVPNLLGILNLNSFPVNLILRIASKLPHVASSVTEFSACSDCLETILIVFVRILVLFFVLCFEVFVVYHLLQQLHS